MVGFGRLLRILAPLAVVCGALFAVSCGGNSGSTTTPTTYPTSAADTISLSASAGTIPLPAVSPGNSITLNYIGSSATPFPSPFPSTGITLTTTIYSVAPTNAPAPTSAKRVPLSRSNAVGVQYVTFTVSNQLPASFINQSVLNLAPSMPVNQAYFVELDDLSTNTYINTFPGTAVNNGQVTFTHANGFIANNNLANVELNTTDTYLYQFYYLLTGTPATPTPSPSPVSNPSATLVPVATPTPVVVSTTEPMGAQQSFTLPVVAGGFITSVVVPAAGTSAVSLTTSGASSLPSGINAVGNTNSLFPYYVLGFSATSTVALPSPQFSLQLPSNFSDATNEIFGALCTTAACPVDAQDAAIPPASVANGLVTFNGGAFPGFTSVGATTEYLIIYTSRGTPASQSTSVPFAAGSTGTIVVPPIPSTSGVYSSTVTLSGLSAATTVSVGAQNGLFSSITAIVPNSQTIIYGLSLNASPQVSTSGLACGSSGCSTVVLTVPASVVSTVSAAGKNFFVEECTAAACPVSTNDVLQLVAPNAASQVVVPPTFGTDITSLFPPNSTSTSYLIFFYK